MAKLLLERGTVWYRCTICGETVASAAKFDRITELKYVAHRVFRRCEQRVGLKAWHETTETSAEVTDQHNTLKPTGTIVGAVHLSLGPTVTRPTALDVNAPRSATNNVPRGTEPSGHSRGSPMSDRRKALRYV
ncbi:MAG: hypothetical protein HLX51_00570 [Micrococcaceae bacterium]|nr:hypothetical protein [Micrococcaceae bacterium]